MPCANADPVREISGIGYVKTDQIRRFPDCALVQGNFDALDTGPTGIGCTSNGEDTGREFCVKQWLSIN